MTRKEAIEFIKNIIGEESGRCIGKEGFYAELIGYHIEALKMAIQALSQEPISLNDINNALGASFRNGVRSAKVEQEPCDDAISREAAINIASLHCLTIDETVKALEQLPSVTVRQTEAYIDGIHAMGYREDYKDAQKQKSGKWIALVTRPMTNEEREYYSEQLDYCDGDGVIYDCPLPEEGQDVLITTCTGWVLIDTFFNDYDGCGFEGYDIEDVKAWMPLPKPYEPQESEE